MRRTTTPAASGPRSSGARRLPGGARLGRLRSLVVPRTEVGVDFLTDVLEALAALPVRVPLVLDDAHHLRARRRCTVSSSCYATA